MSIYDITFLSVFKNLLAPKKRKKRNIAYLGVFAAALQWNRDLYFNEFTNGSSAPDYAGAGNAKGDRVKYKEAIYEALYTVPAATPPTDTIYWLKVCDNWIGTNERIKYNAQKVVFEWLLNKRFGGTFSYTAGASDIYIVRNTVDTTAFYSGIDSSESSYAYTPDTDALEFVGPGSGYSSNIYSYTIMVLNSLFTPLGPDAITREEVIRSIVDKYNILGILYDVQTY
ncbi:hypothetical protein UFOVP1596_52 [uncultured Caudovirales phage]|uniref:Uncharacterized protein n=1 Tax=uncultured Caudovirales phage TaxID=2100421 RepID=A0A6J5SUJ6_9CAUD|nr:hypothetical protein UFOVP1596_52 [uncultured Caudovirales phage]